MTQSGNTFQIGSEVSSSQGESPAQPTDTLTDSTAEQVAIRLNQSPTEQYGVWGRIEMIDGKKYLIRPSVRLGKDGNIEEFAQKVPILSLEVKWEKVELLGLPLEALGMTQAQQQEFEALGGLINPPPEIATLPQNQDKMIYWNESFEYLQENFDQPFYTGFDYFIRVYEGFSDIHRMTKEEATEAGLYPTIHNYNFATCKWIAEMSGGHLANWVKAYNGKLYDIYYAAEGKTNLQKFAAMGQALFGYRCAFTKVFGLGNFALLGSDVLNGSLYGHRDYTTTDDNGALLHTQAVSCVVIMNT